MKTILFVIDSLHSGGAEKSLLSLLTLFDYENYKVDLLLFSQKGLYLPLLPKEVNVLEVPPFLQRQSGGIKSLITARRFKDLYLSVRRSISLRLPAQTKRLHSAQISWEWLSKGIEPLDGHYDVAIAYSQGTPTYFVTEKVKADKKMCWVNTDYKMAPYNNEFDTKFYGQFDHVVAVSDYNKDVFTEEMPIAKEKTSVVYDIVSPGLIVSMSEQEGGFQDDFDGVRVLTIGRLVEAKGYDLALEACSKLIQEGFKLRWYVIGEGQLKEKLVKTIQSLHLEEYFIFLGTFQNPYTFIKQCDLYVQPSRFEGFGLAIAEAKILQKPVIATNFTVVHNQLTDGENGLIVDMNANALYTGIKKLLSEQSLKDKIRSRLAKEELGTEREIEKVYAMIESYSKTVS
ncbi:glycosyltransferase [Paenibacillus sp. HWE-109]|uniref:glycosyltransferase n=1 Tax=Paenibacillus sp. HWE-109 TaxID=1306526 RepID=UPI001EE01A74|nr:glycosyltransferase [Paenibacillus sp. HWE-109]UKS24918.1 glycosyltransferase [Paenibacillus sp. HWE-109]